MSPLSSSAKRKSRVYVFDRNKVRYKKTQRKKNEERNVEFYCSMSSKETRHIDTPTYVEFLHSRLLKRADHQVSCHEARQRITWLNGENGIQMHTNEEWMHTKVSNDHAQMRTQLRTFFFSLPRWLVNSKLWLSSSHTENLVELTGNNPWHNIGPFLTARRFFSIFGSNAILSTTIQRMSPCSHWRQVGFIIHFHWCYSILFFC